MKAIDSIQFGPILHNATNAGDDNGVTLRDWRCLALMVLMSAVSPAGAHDHHRESNPNPPASAQTPASRNSVQTLPSLPAGVTEIKFGEFFVSPVGQRGLELTEKLRSLDGRRVRILGYMAHRDAQPPGVFLLTPFPAQVHDHDNALAEDLPASVVQVSVPTLRNQPVPHVPGLMLLTGTLRVGNQAEPDGRVSLLRLDLDPPDRTVKEKSQPARTGDTKGAALLMKFPAVSASRLDAVSHRTQTNNQQQERFLP